MEGVLSAYLHTLVERKASLVERRNSGASRSDFDTLEARTPLTLPEELKVLWGRFNGVSVDDQVDTECTFDGTFALYPVDWATQEYARIAKEQSQGFEDFSALPIGVLPIGCSLFGDILCVSCDTNSASTGQVFVYSTDEGDFTCCANSLEDYFKGILAWITQGYLIVDDDGLLDLTEIEAAFELAGDLNPGCEYWNG